MAWVIEYTVIPKFCHYSLTKTRKFYCTELKVFEYFRKVIQGKYIDMIKLIKNFNALGEMIDCSHSMGLID